MYMDTGNPYGGIGRTTGGVDVYAPVIRAFEDYHAARHILHKLPESNVEFELCYYYPPEGFNDYPTLTYHFEGADYVVDGKNVLVHFPGFFCVGVRKTEGWSVLGALLMQDKRIIVDGMNSKIQFYPEQLSLQILLLRNQPLIFSLLPQTLWTTCCDFGRRCIEIHGQSD
ncbi:hypothetical protein Q3G72_011736 [Acer saccharum]|nr:hypothetical protein Q3G72_011736 [Acer saccharum]